MAFDLLSGGAITFVLIAAVILVIVMLYRTFFGNKPLGNLLGSASKHIGGVFKGVANLRNSVKGMRNNERGYDKDRKEIAEISSSVDSQLEKVSEEKDFNSDRVNTIKKEINQIKSMALDDLKISNNLLKEAKSGSPIVKGLKDIIPEQNLIESKVALLENNLRRHNLQFSELQMIKKLSEEIKKSSTTITELEMQETQIDFNLVEIINSRIPVIQQLLTLIDATLSLLDQDPPLEHVSEMEENINKIRAASSSLSQYSLDSLLERKDQIIEQISQELTQIQQRSVAQEEIEKRATIFIQSEIARGAASKKDLP